MKLEVKIKKLPVEKGIKQGIIPKYAHDTDAGLDLTAIDITYDKITDTYIYHTGLAFEIPEGYVMLLFPRSSIRNKKCFMCNSVGVIDSGYRGEVTASFKLRDSRHDHTPPYGIGDRIAQAIIIPYPKIEFVEADELSDSDRGIGGHGSTGN